jgi:PAS domain S-box-containing protein
LRLHEYQSWIFLLVDYGPINYVFIGVNYVLAIIAAVTAIQYWRNRTGVFRAQASLLLLSLSLPFLAGFVDILFPDHPVDWLIMGYVLSCIPAGYGLIRYRLLDIIPTARTQVFNSINDVVLVLDIQDRIVDVNPAAEKMLNKPISAIIGQYLLEIIPEAKDISRRCTNTSIVHDEITLTIANELRYLELRNSPLQEGSGNITGRIILVQDITNRKEAEKQKIELELEREKVRILQSFIDDTSHDLKTPITGLLNSTYLLSKYSDKLMPESDSSNLDVKSQYIDQATIKTINLIKKHAGIIRDTSQRLHQLVEQKYELAKLDAKVSLDPVATDLNGLIDKAVNSLRPLAIKKSIDMIFSPDTHLTPVFVDPLEFPRVIENLLNNSIQFTPENGTIHVRTFQQNNHACVEVVDTGIGIAKEHLPNIFNRFYRTDLSRSTKTGGIGLGLAIAKKIVEAHQGSIEVKSELNKGTVFTIRLSAVQPSL